MYSTAQYRNIQYNALILSAIQFDSTGQDRTGQYRKEQSETILKQYSTIPHSTCSASQDIKMKKKNPISNKIKLNTFWGIVLLFIHTTVDNNC
jgi:hypothetical protein